MFLVKIGGSVITNKSKYRVFREKKTSEIIDNLGKMGEPFVLVHGGGSFGHLKAKEYSLPGPLTKESVRGFTIVHGDMVDLSQKVVKIMIRTGLNGISIPPAFTMTGGSLRTEIFQDHFDRGFIPVTFGDTYIRNSSAEIISGDDLVLQLAVRLKPDRVIFLTDVDGIYDRNPKKYADARLLRSLAVEAKFEMHGTDVTGGMENKVRVMKKISELGATVYLLNGNVSSRLHEIGTDRFTGTVIKSITLP